MKFAKNLQQVIAEWYRVQKENTKIKHLMLNKKKIRQNTLSGGYFDLYYFYLKFSKYQGFRNIFYDVYSEMLLGMSQCHYSL